MWWANSRQQQPRHDNRKKKKPWNAKIIEENFSSDSPNVFSTIIGLMRWNFRISAAAAKPNILLRKSIQFASFHGLLNCTRYSTLYNLYYESIKSEHKARGRDASSKYGMLSNLRAHIKNEKKRRKTRSTASCAEPVRKIWISFDMKEH